MKWYIETMEDFWSGNWNDSPAAYIFMVCFYVVLFGGMFFWKDICWMIGYMAEVLTNPPCALAAGIFYLRLTRRWSRQKINHV